MGKKLTIAAIVVIGGLCGILLLAMQKAEYHLALHDTSLAGKPSKVWHLLTDIPYWADWWPGLATASLSGPIRLGSELSVSMKGGEEGWKGRLVAVEPLKRLSWEQEAPYGSKMVTTFAVEPGSDGTRFGMALTLIGPQAFFARLGRDDALVALQQGVVAGFAKQFNKKYGKQGA